MKSNIKRLSLCLSALMLLILASPLTVLAAEEEVAASAKFYGTFWSLVPPLVAIALALTKGFKGTNAFRTVFFMPNLIGGIVLGYIWQTLLNGLLSKWGQPLLALSAKNGFIGMLILLCWQQIGYMMIIYVAGLNNVSPDLIEAAQIDGATSRQILFKIKLPMIMPSVTICTFLTLTNGFKMFDQNLSLTGGDPAKQSQLLALNIYDTFYARSGPQWKGIGQAKAVVFFILVVAIALIQLKATSSKEVQQ